MLSPRQRVSFVAVLALLVTLTAPVSAQRELTFDELASAMNRIARRAEVCRAAPTSPAINTSDASGEATQIERRVAPLTDDDAEISFNAATGRVRVRVTEGSEWNARCLRRRFRALRQLAARRAPSTLRIRARMGQLLARTP